MRPISMIRTKKRSAKGRDPLVSLLAGPRAPSTDSAPMFSPVKEKGWNSRAVPLTSLQVCCVWLLRFCILI